MRMDAGPDLWAFWHDNRLKPPFWFNVAKDVALIQPSSVFMERVFSILLARLDERQDTCYSDRIRASAFLKCVCVCVFFPSILDIKFVGRTSRGHTGGRSHRISNPPSFCGACLDFCARRIQPFLSLVDREVEFCVLTN